MHGPMNVKFLANFAILQLYPSLGSYGIRVVEGEST